MKEKYIYFYYIVLLLVLVSWTNPNTSPSFMVRLLYMASLFLPTVIWKQSWFPAVFTCFVSISQYGISYSYLPETVSLFLWLTLAIYVVRKNKSRLPIFPQSIYFLLAYVAIVSITADFNIYHIVYALGIVCLISFLFDANYHDAEKKLSMAFIVTTIVLCYYFIAFKDTFSVDYKYGVDLDRIGWTDPNYLGCVIGMGAMCCAVKIFDGQIKGYIRTLLIFILGLACIVMIMNASRGALLALSSGIAVLLFTSKIKPLYKTTAVISILIFLYYLYNNSYFDLLEYRIDNDETGSGRSIIWSGRLSAFFTNNPFYQIFGYGYDASMTLGTNKRIGSHNDYIAFLVEYGYIGFALFINMLIYPLIKVIKQVNKSPIVISLCVYLLMCSSTLEPLSLGRIPYYMFYMYIMIVVNKIYCKNKIE